MTAAAAVAAAAAAAYKYFVVLGVVVLGLRESRLTRELLDYRACWGRGIEMEGGRGGVSQW